VHDVFFSLECLLLSSSSHYEKVYCSPFCISELIAEIDEEYTLCFPCAGPRALSTEKIYCILTHLDSHVFRTKNILSRTRNTHCVERVWALSFLERRIYIVFSLYAGFSVFGLSRFENEEIYIVFSVIGLRI